MIRKVIKNNQQVLAKMLKTLDDFDLAILRERLISTTNYVIQNEELVKEQMKDGFISPNTYIKSIKKIASLIKFED